MTNGESFEGVDTHTGTLLNRSKDDLFNKNRNNINSTCIYNNYIINFSRNNNSNIRRRKWIISQSKKSKRSRNKSRNERRINISIA